MRDWLILATNVSVTIIDVVVEYTIGGNPSFPALTTLTAPFSEASKRTQS
jgi:hypothetical protein